MSAALAVREAAPDDPALDAASRADPDGMIYGATPFLRFLREATGARVGALVAEEPAAGVGAAPVAALPFAVLEREGLGRIVNSLPWWGSHGGVVLDRAGARAEEARGALLAAFAGLVARLAPLSSTVILTPEEEPHRAAYEAALRPTARDDRIGQVTPLPPWTGSEAEFRAVLLAGFGQKTRNLARKALSQGFEERAVDDDSAWNFLHATHAANIAALGGRAKPRAHFEALRRTIPAPMRRLTLALDAGEPVAALLTLRFNRTVEYVTPAVRVEHRARQPLTFLIVRGMEDAARAGFAVWNWGGTWGTQTSLHHFKSGFGARDLPYSYVVTASAEGLALFRERRNELAELFPFFYAYPYGALDDPP